MDHVTNTCNRYMCNMYVCGRFSKTYRCSPNSSFLHVGNVVLCCIRRQLSAAHVCKHIHQQSLQCMA